MHARPRRRWRRLRRSLTYGALVALILLAALVGLANQLLPVVDRHPDEVAAWLSERVDQPVAFSALDARWTRRGPRLRLHDLVVGEGEAALVVGTAELQFSVYSGLLPGMPFTELSISGLALTLHQDDEGRWRIEGLPRPRLPRVDPLDLLEGFGELRVQNARLVIAAERWGMQQTLPRADLRLRVDGGQLRGGARLWPAQGGEPLELAVRLARDGSEGAFWLGTEGEGLADWRGLLAGHQLEWTAGAGRLEVWGRLQEHRVSVLQFDADLRGLDLARQEGGPALRFEEARFAARWSAGAEGGWQLSVPEGRFRHAGASQRIERFWMAGGPVRAVEADRIDLAPLLALAALNGPLSPALAGWLAAARPSGTLRELVLEGDHGALRGRARLESASFAAVGRKPGLAGLAGELQFDGAGAVLALRQQDLQLDWPSEWSVPLPLRLDGDLVLWRESADTGSEASAGFGLGSGGLQIDAPGLRLQPRFALELPGAGAAPRLELAAAFEPFDLQALRRYWPHTAMPEPTRRWLDEALLAGRADSARLVMAGAFGDWPFRTGEGLFEARVRLDDVRLRFNPDWPEATDLSGEVVFDGPGLRLEGLQGRLLEVPVAAAEGRITDFRRAWLDLELRGGEEAAGLRRLLLASPLRRELGEHLDALSISGPARADVRLRLPLVRGLGQEQVTGELHLDGTRLADRRWDLRFDDVRGTVPFTERGMSVDALPVLYQQHPARFSLRLGDRVTDAANAAEFDVEAELPPAVLLRRAPELAWLESWLQGSSAWRVAVTVPERAADGRLPPARLRLASDLVGTRLGLPAPLRKSAATALPLRLELPLPVNAGEMQLNLGRLMRLRGQLGDGVRPFAAVAEFGGIARPMALPEAGIAVHGRMPSLDIAGWVAAAAAGDAGQGGLRSVDVEVGAIDVLDRSFGDGRVELRRDLQGLHVAFEGAAIAGTVRVPLGEGATVQGRFARLHWPPMDTEAMTGRAGDAPAVDDTDPARLPPMDFRIEDLRLGEARLGRAVLQTFPTPEGLHIDRFSTASEAFDLAASGHWTRIGDRTRSRFVLDFEAASLGSMLDALGFVGMVEDGPINARMVGGWPGSPGSFRLDRYEGSLRVEVGKGRLLDVEPGTGRLLGLVSIAEIPRRLALDFSDFFAKGFAFNAMRGDFQFEAGAARTENLWIDGPAAEIRISGSTALAARQYDQRVEVLPKAGGVLPALGAFTGGPAGAALGAVAQAVFQLPLKQATRTVYSVQGPWADPEVRVLERGPGRPTARPLPETAAAPITLPGLPAVTARSTPTTVPAPPVVSPALRPPDPP